MRSPRLTFLLCLLISAATHALLIWKLPRYAGTGPPPAKKETQPPIAVMELPKPEPPPDPWGEAGGQGRATIGSPGQKPQTAKESASDQAAFTREPTGQGPAAQPRPSEQPQQQPQQLEQPVSAPPPAALPTPPPSKFPTFRKPEKPKPPAEKSSDQPQAKPQPPTPPAGATPPTPAGGRPMPHSDRDSDPFAKETSVDFEPGEVTAKNGRLIKFARPDDSLSAFVDSATVPRPAYLVLEIDIDETGRPRDVTISHSTGSPSLDQVLRIATFKSWFEPKKGPDGRPIRGKSEFSIAIR